VQCYGADQASANIFCGSGTPECDLTHKNCVECLTANNATGQDCGYPLSSTNRDPHYAKTCDPSTDSCVDGCQFDSQCGCPRNGPGGSEGSCTRFPDQEHCDPNRTSMAGVSGQTLGACVQCTNNTHCEYKIHGTTQYGGTYATMNGSRCLNDNCVEGCDVDADCWPDHTTSNGKICHLGTDANNHKCVECQCDVLSPDGTYCELKSDNSRACANTNGGYPQVCDKDTLTCRRKRQGESCDFNTDCGASAASLNSTCLSQGGGSFAGGGFCALYINAGPSNSTLYCDPAHGTPGKCSDFCDNVCTCGAGSTCVQATSVNGSYTACVPVACNNP
jgi:hypothetical protein